MSSKPVINTISVRNDTPVIGPLLPYTSSTTNNDNIVNGTRFYIGFGDGGSIPINYHFLLYNTGENYYVSGGGCMSYVLGLSDNNPPKGYTANIYFKYQEAPGGYYIIPFNSLTSTRYTSNGKPVYLSVSTTTKHFTFVHDIIPSTFIIEPYEGEKYKGYRILAGTRYSISYYGSDGNRHMFAPDDYPSDGTYSGKNKTYWGIPIKLKSKANDVPSYKNCSVIFYPKSYYSKSNTLISNPIYYYCTYLNAAGKGNNDNFYKNYCTTSDSNTTSLPDSGFTRQYDINVAKGLKFFYNQESVFCGDNSYNTKDTLGQNRPDTISQFGKTVNGQCIFNENTLVFDDISPYDASNTDWCNSTYFSTCSNASNICSQYCPICPTCTNCCTDASLKTCTNQSEICAKYEGVPLWLWFITAIIVVILTIIIFLLYSATSKGNKLENKLKSKTIKSESSPSPKVEIVRK